MRAGVLAARAARSAFTDADLAYAPDPAPAAPRRVESGLGRVVGNRRHKRPRYLVRAAVSREVGGKVVNW